MFDNPPTPDHGSLLGNPVIPSGERLWRGTGVALCYPTSQQRVAISVRTVVPRARLEAWIPWGACGLVVGDDPPWCPRSVSIPVASTAFTRPSPACCPRVPLAHSPGCYASTQARSITP